MKLLIAEAKEQGFTITDDVDWGSYGPLTFVELTNNANLTAINNQLKDFIQRKKADQKKETFLFPMKDWRLYSEFANGKPTGGGRIQQVRMLSLHCMDYFIDCLYQFYEPGYCTQREKSKRSGCAQSAGLRQKKLIAQFMGEAFMMSAMATAIAVLIMTLSLPAFNC